jgi:hypothetical protein
MEQRALIFQVTVKKLFQLNRTNPHTATFGTEEISLTSVYLVGMNGFIIVISLLPTLSRKNALDNV